MKKYTLILLSTILTSCGFEIVDTGHIGVKTKFSRITETGLQEGLHFYVPFVGNSIHDVDMRVRSFEGEEPTFTKDNQEIKVKYQGTYRLDPKNVEFIFRNGNEKYFDIVAPQIIVGVMKEVVGQFDAETIVSKRPIVNDDIFKAVAENLKAKFILLDNYEVTNFSFDPQYQKAIEDKMIATQKAKEAENKTAQIREEKAQTILTAEGQAESMRIRAKALSENRGLVEFEMVQKWNGELPKIMTGSGSTLLDVSKFTGK